MTSPTVTAPRPPTPPRRSSQQLPLSRHPHQLQSHGIVSKIENLGAPSSTPPSSSADSVTSLTRTEKRVNFSPWMDYLLPNSRPRAIHSPKSAGTTMPKSILKTVTATPTQLIPHSYDDMNVMIQSILCELASESTNSRLDAYYTLTNSLRTHNNFPDRQILEENMTVLCQYIQRDLDSGIPGEALNTEGAKLAAQAVKMLCQLAWDGELTKLLKDDFKVFSLERSIQALGNPNGSKNLTLLYMHFISSQKFGPKIMTHDRVIRLIATLEKIDERVSGNNVVWQRLNIYLRLLGQNRTVMASKVNLWIDHLLSGMFSSMKETRTRAIRFGIQAGLDLGSSNIVSDTIKDTLNRELEDGSRQISYLVKKLIDMTAIKGDRDQVPQIWSVVILLLRGRRRTIQNWEHLKEWLQVIQKCFNCGGVATESQTYLAWNRLVFANSIETSNSGSMIRLLRTPIASKFQAQAGPKGEKAVKSTTLSAYCNLLYYAFRPGTSSVQMDLFWNEYVVAIMKDSFLANQENSDYACSILSSLIWNANPNVWNVNLANETKIVEAKDLPRLDCKWIRSKLSSILALVERLCLSATWDSGMGSTPVTDLWASLAKALGEACSKEIKPTLESRQSIALVCNTLSRIWNGQPEALDATGADAVDVFVGRFRFLIKRMIADVGAFLFMETSLTMSAQGTFEPSPIVSSRPTKTLGSQPAVLQMISLVASHCDFSILAGSHYLHMIKGILSMALAARSSVDSKLEFLKNAAEFISLQTQRHRLKVEAFNVIWKSAAELAQTLIPLAKDTFQQAEDSLATPYDGVVRLLELGIEPTDGGDRLGTWGELFSALVDGVTHTRGTSEATAIAKPLLEALQEQQWFNSSSGLASEMFANSYPSPDSATPIQVSADLGSAEDKPEITTEPRARSISSHRPRHEDSQITFVPIQPSSESPKPDSQTFTEHQREVRDRQRDQRSEIKNFWSGDVPADSQIENEAPPLPPLLRMSRLDEREEDVPSTPEIQPQTSDDAFVGSSPTPRSNRATPSNQDAELPSTPPSLQDAQDPPSSPPATEDDLPDLDDLFRTADEASTGDKAPNNFNIDEYLQTSDHLRPWEDSEGPTDERKKPSASVDTQPAEPQDRPVVVDIEQDPEDDIHMPIQEHDAVTPGDATDNQHDDLASSQLSIELETAMTYEIPAIEDELTAIVDDPTNAPSHTSKKRKRCGVEQQTDPEEQYKVPENQPGDHLTDSSKKQKLSSPTAQPDDYLQSPDALAGPSSYNKLPNSTKIFSPNIHGDLPASERSDRSTQAARETIHDTSHNSSNDALPSSPSISSNIDVDQIPMSSTPTDVGPSQNNSQHGRHNASSSVPARPGANDESESMPTPPPSSPVIKPTQKNLSDLLRVSHSAEEKMPPSSHTHTHEQEQKQEQHPPPPNDVEYHNNPPPSHQVIELEPAAGTNSDGDCESGLPATTETKVTNHLQSALDLLNAASISTTTTTSSPIAGASTGIGVCIGVGIGISTDALRKIDGLLTDLRIKAWEAAAAAADERGRRRY